MIESISFAIPTEFAAGLANGSLIRIGTLLKESGTGRIVAHIQETGLAQNLLSEMPVRMFPPQLGSPAELLSLASSGYANFQLDQLKTMVEGLHGSPICQFGCCDCRYWR